MRVKKPSSKRFIIAAIVVLAAGGFIVQARQSGDEETAVETVTVKRGTVMSSVSGNGALQALTTVEVRSNVGGQVVELAVDEGDSVKSGQLIARIDPSDLLSSLEQANADYASAKAKVDQSRQTLQMQRVQTTEGIESARQALEASRERLAQADCQAKVQPELTAEAIAQAESSLESARASLEQTKSALVPQKVAAAKAAYNQAKAAREQAEKTLKRERALLAKGYVSQSRVDEVEEQAASAAAQLDSAKSKYDTVQLEADQDLKSAESKAAQARSALATAKANKVQDTLKRKELAATRASYKQAVSSLALAEASSYQNRVKSGDILQAQAQLERAKAAVENAQTQLGYTRIVAPRGGVVVKKYVEKGSIVTAGKQAMGGSSGSGITVVEIADTSRMRVVVDVDETDVGRIKLGQEVDVSVDACPDDLFPARVTKIAPMATVSQNVTTVPVTVELEQTDPRLKPEMNATCDFVIERRENVLYVPVEAVSETDSGTEVTLPGKDKQITCKIEVGVTGDDYCEVVSGLKEGQTVILPEEDTTKKSSAGGPGGGPPPPM